MKTLSYITMVAAIALITGFTSSVHAADLAKDANTTCPVMQKEEIDPDIFVDYNGERVYLCCTKCKKRFAQDPDKYLARIHAADAATTASKKTASK